MSNLFIESIRTANEHKWCTTPYCTTCGCLEYRQYLRDVVDVAEDGLVDALSTLNPSEITRIPNWQDPLLLAIIDLNWQREQILKSWLAKVSEDIDFTDFVLFEIIKNCSKENETIKNWIDACVTLEKEANSFSLTESLLLVLGNSSLKHTELIEHAKQMAKSSPQMRRVLRNCCQIET